MADVVRCELQFNTLRAGRVFRTHDTCIVKEDIKFVNLRVDSCSSSADRVLVTGIECNIDKIGGRVFLSEFLDNGIDLGLVAACEEDNLGICGGQGEHDGCSNAPIASASDQNYH